MHIKFFRSDFI